MFLPSQPDDTLIGSYAYVGESPPDATNTAEFFVLYNCSTPRADHPVVFRPLRNLPADGPAGGTGGAVDGAARAIPTLGTAALALMSLLIAALGGRARSRRA